jgi:hypothetical protein
MRSGFAGSLIVLLLEPVCVVSKESNVRAHGPGMQGKLETNQAVSVGPDGKLSAVRKSAATMHCKNPATFEGCFCDNRAIGTGITGNFVNDSLTFESFNVMEMPKSFWEYTAYQEGELVFLDKFKKGKLTLIANVASA